MAKRILFITIAVILCSGCAGKWKVYYPNEIIKPDDKLNHTLFVFKIHHNYYEGDEFGKTHPISFKFVISDKPEVKQAFYATREVKVTSEYSNYIFASFKEDAGKNRFIYLEGFENKMANTYGSFVKFKNNYMLEYAPHGIEFLGTFVIGFRAKKYSMLFLKPTLKERQIVLNEVVKKFKGTRFEQMARQELDELKKKQ